MKVCDTLGMWTHPHGRHSKSMPPTERKSRVGTDEGLWLHGVWRVGVHGSLSKPRGVGQQMALGYGVAWMGHAWHKFTKSSRSCLVPSFSSR